MARGRKALTAAEKAIRVEEDKQIQAILDTRRERMTGKTREERVDTLRKQAVKLGFQLRAA